MNKNNNRKIYNTSIFPENYKKGDKKMVRVGELDEWKTSKAFNDN